MKRERGLLTGLSAALILPFLWQLVSPDHESPSNTLKFLTIALNTGGIIGLVGLTFRILTSTSPPGNATGQWLILPVLGLAAAVGSFVWDQGMSRTSRSYGSICIGRGWHSTPRTILLRFPVCRMSRRTTKSCCEDEVFPPVRCG